MAKRIDVEGLNAWFGSFQALDDVSITVEPVAENSETVFAVVFTDNGPMVPLADAPDAPDYRAGQQRLWRARKCSS